MIVVIINGAPESGKSLFVELCKKHYKNLIGEYSTVDFVKEVAKYCGWDGTKTPANRNFLSELKDLLIEWKDIPFNKTIRAIKIFENELNFEYWGSKNGIFFIHCREPNEIDKLKQPTNGITLCIRREIAEDKEVTNHADAEVLNYSYDYVITNNSTIRELEEKAVQFCEEVLNK